MVQSTAWWLGDQMHGVVVFPSAKHLYPRVPSPALGTPAVVVLLLLLHQVTTVVTTTIARRTPALYFKAQELGCYKMIATGFSRSAGIFTSCALYCCNHRSFFPAEVRCRGRNILCTYLVLGAVHIAELFLPRISRFANFVSRQGGVLSQLVKFNSSEKS